VEKCTGTSTIKARLIRLHFRKSTLPASAGFGAAGGLKFKMAYGRQQWTMEVSMPMI